MLTSRCACGTKVPLGHRYCEGCWMNKVSDLERRIGEALGEARAGNGGALSELGTIRNMMDRQMEKWPVRDGAGAEGSGYFPSRYAEIDGHVNHRLCILRRPGECDGNGKVYETTPRFRRCEGCPRCAEAGKGE